MLAMVYRGFQSLSPAGLLIKDIAIEPDRVVVIARCRGNAGKCPDCGQVSDRLHSRYERRLLDLPSQGRAVQIRIAVRRFRCAAPECRRRIFAEALGDTVAGRSARRTARLEAIVHHLGIALGGRPAAALARRLRLPVSKDTLLRTIRRHAAADRSPLHVIGIDDWAWKRGQRYGSIVCDLERRRVVDLLPDREPSTVEGWLSRHPEITIISRDRGGGYGQAASRAAPQAVQIADRWHLMENASAAFLEAVRRSMRQIRIALGSTTIDPALLTHAERLQHEGYLRREEAYEIIRALAKAGTSIKEIVRRTGRSRKLVRDIVRGGGGDVFRCRSNVLEPHLAWLDAEWSAGCRNGAELWRRLQAATGFRGAAAAGGTSGPVASGLPEPLASQSVNQLSMWCPELTARCPVRKRGAHGPRKRSKGIWQPSSIHSTRFCNFSKHSTRSARAGGWPPGPVPAAAIRRSTSSGKVMMSSPLPRCPASPRPIWKSKYSAKPFASPAAKPSNMVIMQACIDGSALQVVSTGLSPFRLRSTRIRSRRNAGMGCWLSICDGLSATNLRPSPWADVNNR
jgi:transposase